MTIISYLLGFIPDANMLATLFTVLSIFISIGLSIIISFDLSKIKNDFLFNKISSNLKIVRKNFIYYFGCIVCSYIFYPRLVSICKPYNLTIFEYNIVISLTNLVNDFVFSLMVFGIIYYLYNFYSLQNLKNEIANELRKS